MTKTAQTQWYWSEAAAIRNRKECIKAGYETTDVSYESSTGRWVFDIWRYA